MFFKNFQGVFALLHHLLQKFLLGCFINFATGTGLGLHVVRTLAEAQNGRVTYRPGQYGGSVFTISLMAVTEPPLSEPPVEGAGGPTDRS